MPKIKLTFTTALFGASFVLFLIVAIMFVGRGSSDTDGAVFSASSGPRSDMPTDERDPYKSISRGQNSLAATPVSGAGDSALNSAMSIHASKKRGDEAELPVGPQASASPYDTPVPIASATLGLDRYNQPIDSSPAALAKRFQRRTTVGSFGGPPPIASLEGMGPGAARTPSPYQRNGGRPYTYLGNAYTPSTNYNPGPNSGLPTNNIGQNATFGQSSLLDPSSQINPMDPAQPANGLPPVPTPVSSGLLSAVGTPASSNPYLKMSTNAIGPVSGASEMAIPTITPPSVMGKSATRSAAMREQPTQTIVKGAKVEHQNVPAGWASRTPSSAQDAAAAVAAANAAMVPSLGAQSSGPENSGTNLKSLNLPTAPTPAPPLVRAESSLKTSGPAGATDAVSDPGGNGFPAVSMKVKVGGKPVTSKNIASDSLRSKLNSGESAAMERMSGNGPINGMSGIGSPASITQEPKQLDPTEAAIRAAALDKAVATPQSGGGFLSKITQPFSSRRSDSSGAAAAQVAEPGSSEVIVPSFSARGASGSASAGQQAQTPAPGQQELPPGFAGSSGVESQPADAGASQEQKPGLVKRMFGGFRKPQ